MGEWRFKVLMPQRSGYHLSVIFYSQDERNVISVSEPYKLVVSGVEYKCFRDLVKLLSENEKSIKD